MSLVKKVNGSNSENSWGNIAKFVRWKKSIKKGDDHHRDMALYINALFKNRPDELNPEKWSKYVKMLHFYFVNGVFQKEVTLKNTFKTFIIMNNALDILKGQYNFGKENPYIIGVVGNIGTGKTTLCETFCEIYDATFIPEPVKEKVFLKLLEAQYKKKAAGFDLQIFIILTFVFRMFSAMFNRSSEVVIVERTFLEERLFRKVLLDKKIITQNEYDVIEILSGAAARLLTKFNLLVSDLIIWLNVPVYETYKRICVRSKDRVAENNIDINYLYSLDSEYQELGKKYTTGILRTENPSSIIITEKDQKNLVEFLKKRFSIYFTERPKEY